MNAYSSRSRDALLAAFPEFESHLTENREWGDFVVEFPAPSGERLAVSTEGDEVTVGFAEHHVHFTDMDKRHPEDDVQAAIEYIRKLMNGTYEVVVWKRDGTFMMSCTIQRGEGVPRLSLFARWWLRKCTVEIKHWDA